MKIQSKSKKVNKAWLNDHVNDTYVKLAHKDGYRSRAAYKLKELDEDYKLIRPGSVVVDLGSTPGAWSQYARRKLAPKDAMGGGAASGSLNGTIISLDLLPMDPIDGVNFILGDFQDDTTLAEVLKHLNGKRVDAVISDMAPNLSGVAASDAARLANLVELAVDFAQKHLTPTGSLTCKLFHGGAYDDMVKLFRDTFKVVKCVKPKASRDKSSETFIVGIGLKAASAQTHLAMPLPG